MPNYHCHHRDCHGIRCKDRYHLKYFSFPNPIKYEEDCNVWIKQCGKPNSDLNVDLIAADYEMDGRSKATRKYFICSKVHLFCISYLMTITKHKGALVQGGSAWRLTANQSFPTLKLNYPTNCQRCPLADSENTLKVRRCKAVV